MAGAQRHRACASAGVSKCRCGQPFAVFLSVSLLGCLFFLCQPLCTRLPPLPSSLLLSSIRLACLLYLFLSLWTSDRQTRGGRRDGGGRDGDGEPRVQIYTLIPNVSVCIQSKFLSVCSSASVYVCMYVCVCTCE